MSAFRRIESGPVREKYLPLLLLSDDLAARSIDEGDLWIYGDGTGAVLTVVTADSGTIELKLVAVAEAGQGKGIGKAMIAALLDRLRADGWRRAIVGTGTADPRTYIFYQRCGFRPWRIERDVFTAERGYDPAAMGEPNGLVHRDMIWFDLVLQNPD